MTRLPGVLAALTVVIAAPWKAQQSPDRSGAIDSYLSALARDGQFSGTVLVARGSEIILEKSYGQADFAARTPVTPATLFAVASLTKPLTGIAARLLTERGVLSLEDPIAKWLPDFPNGAAITVGHLVTHRSGLPHRVTQPSDELQPQTAESMVRLASRVTPAGAPGAGRLYSSAGFSVLARVLELATGKPYAVLMHELVLSPAGAMATVDATESIAPNTPRARGHFWTPDGPLAAPPKQLSYLVGAGSLYTTPRDLFQVVRRIADGGYGAPAVAGAQAANGAIQWTGFSNGFAAVVDYNPATKVTIILTTNLLTGSNDWIIRDVPRLLTGEAVETPQAPRPSVVVLPEPRRKQLEGLYNFGGNRQQLTFVSPTAALLGGEYVLLTTGVNTLFAPQGYADFAVVSDSTGNVVEIRLQAPNGFAFTRIR